MLRGVAWPKRKSKQALSAHQGLLTREAPRTGREGAEDLPAGALHDNEKQERIGGAAAELDTPETRQVSR
jgi:hypothetical protein